MAGIFDQVINYSPPLLTAGQVNYKGTWNAASNTPTLVSPPSALSKGDYYVVSAAGTQFSISFAVGDWIISNGAAWEKVDLTDAVSSVFGRTGAVVGVSTDYSAVGITNTAIGAANPSTGAFTSVAALSNSGYQAVIGQLTSGDRVGISGQASGSGAALVFFDNGQTTFRPAIFDASSHSLKISGVEKASVTSTGLQGAIGATTPAAGAFTSLSSTSGAFNGTVGASTPSTGAFTTLSATGIISVAGGQYFSAGSSGTGAPTFTTRSAGTKVVLYDQISGSSLPFSLGIDSGTLWLAAGGTSDTIKSYVGTSLITTLSSTGLQVTGITSSYYSGATGILSWNSSDTSGTQFVYFAKANGTTIGSIARVTTTDAVVYNTTSDGRLKENLRDFTDSGRLIDSLKPRVFDWKNSDENGKNVIGFIAQEQHAADPIFAHIGAVSVGDEDPETITKQWQRSDSALIPILVAELQSLRQRLAALESN